MKPFLCLSAALLLCVICAARTATGETGVLILAHGGTPEWNRTVEEAVHEAALSNPTEVAFGMGMHAQEVDSMQRAVHQLEAQGVTALIVVPLLISSHSLVYRQYEFLFGLRSESSWADRVSQPLKLRVPAQVAAPLNDHYYLARILAARAQALSTDPSREVVIFVAHGPVSAQDDAAWLATLQRVTHDVRARMPFAGVHVSTLRDDAPEPIRARATQDLRELVARESQQHHVLIVPVLLARGGIEHTIRERLAGLNYTFSGEMVLPDPLIARWIRETVGASTQQI